MYVIGLRFRTKITGVWRKNPKPPETLEDLEAKWLSEFLLFHSQKTLALIFKKLSLFYAGAKQLFKNTARLKQCDSQLTSLPIYMLVMQSLWRYGVKIWRPKVLNYALKIRYSCLFIISY